MDVHQLTFAHSAHDPAELSDAAKRLLRLQEVSLLREDDLDQPVR